MPRPGEEKGEEKGISPIIDTKWDEIAEMGLIPFSPRWRFGLVSVAAANSITPVEYSQENRS